MLYCETAETGHQASFTSELEQQEQSSTRYVYLGLNF